MMKNVSLFLLAGLILPGVSVADQVIDENLVVEQGACVGVDCANGEQLSAGELKLKENNLRIRITNTETATSQGVDNVFGESWNIEVNNSANGGPSYFDFQVKSVLKDTALSDGTAPAYDCDDLAVNKYNIQDLPTIGLVPVGGEIIKPEFILSSCEFSAGLVCLHQCVTDQTLRHTKARVLTFGTHGNGQFADSVAIGFDRDFSHTPDQGVLALGHDDLKRQLVHLADAISASDLVNVGSLNFPRVEAMLAQLALLNQQLDEIEIRIDEYEDSLTNEVDLGTNGSTTTVLLAKRNILNINTPNDTDPYGPKTVELGFYPTGGQPMSGLTVTDEQGNSYSVSGWWQQVSIPLQPGQVSVTLTGQVGESVNVQWWFGW